MTDLAALKRELVALGAATEAGFEAGGEAVERIKTLAAALEAANPTARPADAEALLKGRWRLVYSSFGLQRRTTLARLSFNILPKDPITVRELFQEVDPATGLYDNIVTFTDAGGGPGVSVTTGQFVPASSVRLDIRFTEAIVRGAASLRAPIDKAKIPPLWSDVTYLDEEFRLNRGGFGNLYVLQLIEREPESWSRDT